MNTTKLDTDNDSHLPFRGHINFALGLFDRLNDKELVKVFSHKGKVPPTAIKIRQVLKQYREMGLKFFPPCDNVDETGACKGHENTKS